MVGIANTASMHAVAAGNFDALRVDTALVIRSDLYRPSFPDDSSDAAVANLVLDHPA